MLVRLFSFCVFSSGSLLLNVIAEEVPTDSSKLFREKIAPVLTSRCLSCHGAKQEGGYSVATPEQLWVAGDSDAKPIVAKDLHASELWRRLVTEDASERMPAESDALSKDQLAAFRTWIEAGAPIESTDRQRSISAIAIGRTITAPEHYPRPVAINALSISSNGETIWVGGYAELTQWSISNRELLARVPVAGPHVSAIAIVPDEKSLLVSSGLPGQRGMIERIGVGDLSANRAALDATSDVAADLAVNQAGTFVAIGGQDGSLKFVELLSDGRFGAVELTTPHADSILAVAWSGDGKRLITASRDRTAKLFSGSPMELIASYDRHERAVGGVAFVGGRPLSLDETGKLRLMEGNDSDAVIAEQSGLPRVLQRFVTSGDKIFIADRNRLREFKVESKTIEDGKDDAGKTKTKKVTRFREGPTLTVDTRDWITAVAATESNLAVGTQQGRITVWDRKANEVIGDFVAKP